MQPESSRTTERSPAADCPPVGIPIPTREALAEHEGPRCEQCDYDLTGLTAGRCPECGRTFTIGYVMQGAALRELPAVPWDRQGGVVGFMETWVLSMLSPMRLARGFPARHSSWRAVAYSLIWLAVSAVILLNVVFVGIPMAGADQTNTAASLAACVGFLSGLYLALSFVPDRLARLTPLYAPWPYHFWRGLVLYASGIMPFVAATAGLLGMAAWGDYAENYADQSLLRSSQVYIGFGNATQPPAMPAQPTLTPTRFIIITAGTLLAVLIWWWVVTALMVRARISRRADRLRGYLAILLGFLQAVFLGALIGAAAFIPLFWMVGVVQLFLDPPA